MHLKRVSAPTGLLWFKQGIRTFARSPLIFILLFFSYLFVMGLLAFPPVIGTAIVMVLIPGVSVGFLAASRLVLDGKPAFPNVLASGYLGHGATIAKRLLMLGIAYFAAMCAVFAISALSDGGTLAQMILFGNGSTDDASAASMSSGGAMWLAMLAYIPVAMAFWFAPVLVAWHDIPPHKALFFSLVTCWMNKWAFLIYGLLWLGSTMVISLALTLLTSALGMGASQALMIMMPISCIITAALYASFYATYRGCFYVDGPPSCPNPARAPSATDTANIASP